LLVAGLRRRRFFGGLVIGLGINPGGGCLGVRCGLTGGGFIASRAG
jgi:hypothetical protein